MLNLYGIAAHTSLISLHKQKWWLQWNYLHEQHLRQEIQSVLLEQIGFNCEEKIKINNNSIQEEKVLVSKYLVDYPPTNWESYFKAWLLQEHKLVSFCFQPQVEDNIHLKCIEFSS